MSAFPLLPDDPTVCATSKNGHLLPHETHRKVYYECVTGMRILRRCPRGQSFDSSARRCTITDRRKRAVALRINCSVVRSNQPIAYRHESNCSLYYRCADNVEMLKECQSGLTFNPVLEDCNAQNDTNCLIPEKQITSTTPQVQETTSTTTTTTEVPKPEGPCPSPNVTETVVLLPHQSNCSLYCLCDNGKLKVKECESGFHWNAWLQVCTWPENANCTNSIPSSTPTPIIELPDECPTDETERPIRLPHESKCNVYYECKDGKKNKFHCDDDLIFNPQMQVCVWKENYNCVDKTES